LDDFEVEALKPPRIAFIESVHFKFDEKKEQKVTEVFDPPAKLEPS